MFSIAVLNFLDLYTYDNSGNILEKITYPYFDTAYPTVEPLRRDNYSYPMDGWSDRLLSFNDEQCEYDGIGNPILYRGKTLTWQYGRQLATFDNVAYTYYSDGLRRNKTVNGISTDYIWSDKRLVAENKVAKNLLFKYGISGILGFSYDSKEYTYRKNLQGDITDIVDDSGKVVAHYDYDAYGNQRIYGYHDNEWKLLEDTLLHEGAFVNSSQPIQLPYLLSDKDTLKSNHIAYINPFRYRSYYYDTETNLYYLTTRYYDPETGRFINADPETINGLNLFAYCANNPVMIIDSTGNSPKWWQWLLFGIGAALVATAAILAIVGTGGVAAFGVGALIGSASVGLGGTVIGGVIGYSVGGIDGMLQGALMGFGIGAMLGFAIGGAIGLSSYSASIGINFGKIGTVVKHPGIKVDWSKNTIHATERMTQRGITKNLVNRTVRKGIALSQVGGKFAFITKNAFAFVSSSGFLITTYSKAFYDTGMLEIIKKLFGG